MGGSAQGRAFCIECPGPVELRQRTACCFAASNLHTPFVRSDIYHSYSSQHDRSKHYRSTRIQSVANRDYQDRLYGLEQRLRP